MRGVFLLLCLTWTFVKSHRYLGPRYINLGVVGILRPRFMRGPGSGVIDFRTLRSGGTSFGSVRGPSFVSRTTRVSTLGDIDGGFDVEGSDRARFVTSSTYRPRISLARAPGSVGSFTSSTRRVTSIPSSIYPLAGPDVTDESVSYDALYGRVAGPTGPFSAGTSVGSLPRFGFPDDSTGSFPSSTRRVTSIPSSIYPLAGPDVTDESVSYDALYGRVAGPTGPFSAGTSVGSLPRFGFPDDSTSDGVPGGPVRGGFSSVVESVRTSGPLSGYTDGSYAYQGPVGPIGRGTLSVRGSSVLPGYIDRSGAFGSADEGTSYEDLFGDNYPETSLGIRSVNTGSTSAIRSFAFETSPTYRRIEFLGRPRVVSVRRSTYGDSSLYGTGTDGYVDAATSFGVTRGGRIMSEADAYGQGSQSNRILDYPSFSSSSTYRISDTNIPYRTSDRYKTA